MSNSIRIRTTPNGSDQYLKVKLEQDIDFIEILSLKISQEKAYQKYCSDYGVVVGRVVVNNGFGVPNAKVSVFIPLSDEDALIPELKGLYPFEVVSDKDSEGIRYNLLPKESDSIDDCFTPVGTFSQKREFLDNDKMLDVYSKYYKFTTTTNAAGDFMIFGVPLGTYVIHVDADISNIGIASQRPFDLIDQGVPTKMFDSPTKFKKSKNLDSLVQVKTANVGVNVQPFWGDIENCEIGISRIDIDLNYTLRPAAIFMGSIFGDSHKNSVNKSCRPRKKMGMICETSTGGGTIEMIRKNLNNDIEEFSVDGGRLIDDDGTWAYQIPMNLDYMVTDEFGNLVPSNDESKGVPTRSRVRFRIGLDELGGLGRLRTRAKYLVPHNPKTFGGRDFNFDKDTKDSSFTNLYWNKIYSVKNFIARIQMGGGVDRRGMLGMKDLDNCSGDKTPFPYNRIDTNFSPIFSVLCIILTIIVGVIYFLNIILCAIRDIHFLGIRPFKNLVSPITMTCPSDPPTNYTPGCKRQSGEPFIDCVSAVLSETLNLFELDFYNDWVNGTLYAYSLKYKKKRKGNEKFCEYDCDGFPNSIHKNHCKPKLMLDSCTGTGKDAAKTSQAINILDGYISDNKKTLYYSPILHNGGFKMFATDVISLGSVFDCDWQGIPKLQPYLIPTTFQIPPIITEDDVDEVICGMVNVTSTSTLNGVFFSINCKGVHVNGDNCNNIKKICEYGTDLPTANCRVDRGTIYDATDPVDSVNSINRYMRNVFYGLNISGSSATTFNLPANIDLAAAGTSFSNGSPSNISVNGTAYNNFRNFFPVGTGVYQQPLNNSFYFYFGLLPGRTSLDKLNAKYFTKCERPVTDDFIINTTVNNTSSVGASNGSIVFTFIGGTGPYVYTWVGPSYVNGPITTMTGGAILGLAAGDYTITVTDALGNSNIKTVTVGGPAALTCYVVATKDCTTSTSNDGQVMISSLFGGTAPYTLTYTSTTSSVTIPIAQGDIISNLHQQTYTFTIRDSSTPIQTCASPIKILAPQPLFVLFSGMTTSCDSSDDGEVIISISGGTAPYTIFTTGPTGYTGDTIVQDSLNPGVYATTVTDSSTQSASGSYTVLQGTVPVCVINTIYNASSPHYTHYVNGIGGTPPYAGTGIFNDNNTTYTTTITDERGCESAEVTG